MYYSVLTYLSKENREKCHFSAIPKEEGCYLCGTTFFLSVDLWQYFYFFPFKSVTRMIAGEVSSLSFHITFRRVDYTRKRSDIHNDRYYLWINNWTQLDNWPEAQIQRQGALGKAPRCICLFDTYQMRRTTTDYKMSINQQCDCHYKGGKKEPGHWNGVCNQSRCPFQGSDNLCYPVTKQQSPQ